ncbi:response regulator [Neosynechococcus sphagnicola]|uniref:response regulator n=1 Tax=Neosynechococcus sphagnicola TaxID=1501145 RepID=UPI00068E0DF0|nr:response regulator [Neosynechococcus sphagnicola]
MARQLHPDAITLDVMMPHMDGWTVLTALKADPELAAIPVVMLTMVDERNLGYALGTSDYLTKPIERDLLVRVLTKYQPHLVSNRVLVITADSSDRIELRQLLEREGWTVVETEQGAGALEQIAIAQPDVLLLDLMLPDLDGFEVIAQIRSHPTWKSLPIVVLTAQELTATERLKLSGSVEQIIQKHSQNLEQTLKELQQLVATAVDFNVDIPVDLTPENKP